VEHRFTRDSDEIDLDPTDDIIPDVNPTNYLSANLRVKVTDRLSVSANFQKNFQDDTGVQQGLGINYKAQCWSFEGRITDRVNVDDEHNLDFEIRVKLFGLGEVGI
jgi:hypothetical protein